MSIRTGIFNSLLIGTLAFASLAMAGPGGVAGGKGDDKPAPKAGRLGMPLNVSCSKFGDQLTLSWDAVVDATQYRVYLEAEDGGELVDTVLASQSGLPQPPYTHPMSDMSDDPAAEVKGHVRALGSKMGKDASKPSAHVTCK